MNWKLCCRMFCSDLVCLAMDEGVVIKACKLVRTLPLSGDIGIAGAQ